MRFSRIPLSSLRSSTVFSPQDRKELVIVRARFQTWEGAKAFVHMMKVYFRVISDRIEGPLDGAGDSSATLLCDAANELRQEAVKG